MKRVLKPTGSIFVNLGDKYAGAGPQNAEGRLSSIGNSHHWRQVNPARVGIPNKSLMLLPEAYRLGCTGMLATLGGPDPGLDLIARAVIVWDKPNSIPGSQKDRVNRTHEDWVHLTKNPRYYHALDEIREPHADRYRERAERYSGRAAQLESRTYAPGNRRDANSAKGILGLSDGDLHPLGKVPGSVWPIPSEPLRLPPWITTDHYAAFPTRWPEQLIRGFSPPGICLQCGAGRFPVVERHYEKVKNNSRRRAARMSNTDARLREGVEQDGRGFNTANSELLNMQATILGYACGCCPHTDHPGTGGLLRNRMGLAKRTDQPTRPPGFDDLGDLPRTGPWREWHLDRWTPPPTRPAIILDPFVGTGTTLHVARALGRHAIGVDLSLAYCRIAADQAPGSLARRRAAKVHGRVNRQLQGSLL